MTTASQAQKMDELNSYMAKVEERFAAVVATGDVDRIAKNEKGIAFIRRSVAAALAQTSPTYWQDHRNMTAQAIMLDTANMLGIKE